jgi:hypothetical protein
VWEKKLRTRQIKCHLQLKKGERRFLSFELSASFNRRSQSRAHDNWGSISAVPIVRAGYLKADAFSLGVKKRDERLTTKLGGAWVHTDSTAMCSGSCRRDHTDPRTRQTGHISRIETI